MANIKGVRPDTIYLIYQAAEDWINGDSPDEIAERYNRSRREVDRWKDTTHWADAVGDRKRLKRKPAARIPKYEHFLHVKTAAERWIVLGKPDVDVLSKDLGTPEATLEKWMELPFWEYTTNYVEHKMKRKAERKKLTNSTSKYKTRRPPERLLRQAVFLSLAGWKLTDIAPVIGRNWQTVKGWRWSDAWKECEEDMLLDKLMMHMIDTGLNIQDMFERFFPTGRGDGL